MTKRPYRATRIWPVVLMALALAVAACEADEPTATSGTSIPAYGPNLSLGLPDTLTGGAGAGGVGTGVSVPMARGAQPMAGGNACAFGGTNGQDPFLNGHNMTKFLVSAIAAWTCIADQIIDFVDLLVFLGVPTDGTQINIGDDPGYQAGDATWLQITESGAQTTLVLYWTTVGTPPVAGDAGVYLTWDTTSGVAGKLIVDVAKVADDPSDPFDPAEDPIYLRLDFTESATQKTGDMYLGFDAVQNPWVQGWRIQVVKALDGSYPRYLAKGTIDATAQWNPAFLYADVPQLKSFAVASNLGVGAAIASMVDLGLVLFPVDTDNDHLGTFVFTKDDRYYFGGGPPVVVKTITAGEYRGDRSIVDGASDFIGSPTDIDNYLTTVVSPAPYTGHYAACTTTPSGASDPDCVAFLNALFSQDDWGAEGNVGTEPSAGDQRRDALDGATYFATACPAEAGSCVWSTATGGVFEMTP